MRQTDAKTRLSIFVAAPVHDYRSFGRMVRPQPIKAVVTGHSRRDDEITNQNARAAVGASARYAAI